MMAMWHGVGNHRPGKQRWKPFSIGARKRLMADLLGGLLSNNSRHAAGTQITLMQETIHISSNCLSKGQSTQSTVLL